MKNLFGIKNLKKEEIEDILSLSFWYKNYKRTKGKTPPHILLENKFVGTLFFENSTRTKTSFEIAAKRLGAHVINFNVDHSSLKKGETILDTAITLNEMDIDYLVIRSSKPNICQELSEKINTIILNAGDGANEHPTQALLDAMVIKHNLGTLQDIQVSICGDVRNSRVAKSNLYLLNKMGASVNFVCPPELTPHPYELQGEKVNIYHSLKKGLEGSDVVMMLRIQFERMHQTIVKDVNNFHKEYGLTKKSLSYAKKNAIILHPGPMNRGIEISSEIADSDRCRVREQVKHGVFVRMACFDYFGQNN